MFIKCKMYRDARIQELVLKAVSDSDEEIRNAFASIDNSIYLTEPKTATPEAAFAAEILASLRPWRDEFRFLCVGAGNGWFCHLVSALTSGKALIHGIESDEAEADFARKHCTGAVIIKDSWFSFDVHASLRYDRVYIAGGCDGSGNSMLRFVKVGGILVGAFTAPWEYSEAIIQMVRESPEVYSENLIRRLTREKLGPDSGGCSKKRRTYDRPWSREIHSSYPDSFRCGVKELLMCWGRFAHDLRSVLATHVIPFIDRQSFIPELTSAEIPEPQEIWQRRKLKRFRIPEPRHGEWLPLPVVQEYRFEEERMRYGYGIDYNIFVRS